MKGPDHMMTSIQKAYTGISQELAQEEGIELILLSDNQMLVSKHLVQNAEPAGFKTPPLAPASDGFAIYVSCRSPGKEGERPQQRVTFPDHPVKWDPAEMTLRLNRTALDETWELLNRAGERVSVTVHCGSQQVFNQVDRVLALVAKFLLA